MGMKEAIKKEWIRSKEVFAAYWRQGLHELGAVFYGQGTIAQHPELGMAGTKAPSMIADGLQGKDPKNPTPERDTTPSPLDRYTSKEPEQEKPDPAPERDDRAIERE